MSSADDAKVDEMCAQFDRDVAAGKFNERGYTPNEWKRKLERDAMKTKNPGKKHNKPNGKADHHEPDPVAARQARNDSERAQRFKKLEGLEKRAQLKYSAYVDLKEATSEAKDEYDAILSEIRQVIRGEDTKPILDLAETLDIHESKSSVRG